jgi:HK97 family phage major capsid protein
MSSKTQLMQQRDAKTAELRSAIENPETFDRIDGEVRALDTQIRQATRLEELERHGHADPVNGSRDLAEIESRFSVGKALAEYAERGQLSGLELEYNQERRSGRAGAISMPTSAFMETRAITTSTPAGGPGSNLVATQLGSQIDRLRPSLVVQGLGATVLTGLVGNVDLPRMKAGGTASWVAEGSAATTTDPTFDKVSLIPNSVAAQYEMGRRMMLQAPAMETMLRNDIGYLLRQALDLAAINGAGGNVPLGILQTAGIGTVAMGTNGAALTIDATADLMGKLDAADANGARGFLTNTKVKTAANKLKDSQNNLYGLGQVFRDEPVAFSNQVTSSLTKGTGTNLSALIYGLWSDLIIGYWSNVDIVVNPYADSVASKGGALLHAFLDADVAVRHPESFAAITDIVA